MCYSLFLQVIYSFVLFLTCLILYSSGTRVTIKLSDQDKDKKTTGAAAKYIQGEWDAVLICGNVFMCLSCNCRRVLHGFVVWLFTV